MLIKKELKLEQGKADIESANLEKAKVLLKRLTSVKDPRAISQEDLQIRESDVKIAEAKLRAAKAAIKNNTSIMIPLEFARIE